MKKTNVFILSLLMLFTLPTLAQLPNPSFDQWEPSGSPAPFDWEDPADWTSTNAVTEFVSAGVRKSTTVNSGTFAMQIKATNAPNKQTMVSNGEPTLDFATTSLNIETAGTPVGNRPGGLRGYYQYTPDVSATDSAYALMQLTHYNTTSNTREIVAEGRIDFTEANTYTPFSFTLTELMSGTEPDTVVVVFVYNTNSTQPLPPAGELLIDDLELSPPTGVRELTAIQQQIQVFPNPAHHTLSINQDDLTNHTIQTWSIQDIQGRTCLNGVFTPLDPTITIAELPAGSYLLTLRLDNGSVIPKRFIKP